MGSGWNHGTTTRTMEERLDPLQQAFSTPIAASHAGSVAVPPYDSGGILSENLFVNFPRSGTKPPTGKSRESFASTNTGSISATTSVHTASTNDREYDSMYQQMVQQTRERTRTLDKVTAGMCLQSNAFIQANFKPDSMQMEAYNSGQTEPRSPSKYQYGSDGPDASGWTLPSKHVSRTSSEFMLVPKDDVQVLTLQQVKARLNSSSCAYLA